MKNDVLIILLIIVTAAISGSAAYFSVFGLAQSFAAAAISAKIMGVSLEAGKLVAASFLYQFWEKLGILARSVYLSLVLILMILTSWGIFGFLSNAYQTDTVDLKTDDQRVAYLANEKTGYETRLANIDDQIKHIPQDHVNSKIRLIKALDSEKKDILGKLSTVNDEQQQLMSTKLKTEAKVGPLIFVAKALKKTPDEAAVVLIFIIMSVFDPLAMALTIAINIAVVDRKQKRQAVIPVEKVESAVPKASTQLDELSTRIDGVMGKHNKRTDILNSLRNI